MKHFNYVRFTDDIHVPPGKVLVGVRCFLNNRCICQIIRYVKAPTWAGVSALDSEAESIEGEVRDAVDRMDPEVLR